MGTMAASASAPRAAAAKPRRTFEQRESIRFPSLRWTTPIAMPSVDHSRTFLFEKNTRIAAYLLASLCRSQELHTKRRLYLVRGHIPSYASNPPTKRLPCDHSPRIRDIGSVCKYTDCTTGTSLFEARLGRMSPKSTRSTSFLSFILPHCCRSVF